MALTQVRAKLGDHWVTLDYDPATGRYEGKLTPPGTSIHQPGGYFPITVEAQNDSGQTASLDGASSQALRLAVRETTAPTLTLISPVPGFLTTHDPVFVFEATDEEGGSGVDPDSFSLEGAVVEEIEGGYRLTWTPGSWPDGRYTLTASVSDYDGNVSAVSGVWVMDTTPPVLRLKTPYMRHVVDAESVLISGTAWDANGVEVLVNGVPAGGERFSAMAPLEVGENTITVTARDPAGWEATETIYMLRLITDRTAADVDALRALQRRGVNTWSEADFERFQRYKLRGAYTAEALNRVGLAVDFLTGELKKRGYAPKISPETGWTREDASTLSPGEVYCKNVQAIRDAQGLEWLSEIPVPDTLRGVTQDGANRLEQVLVETDAIFPKYASWSCGEISCGEF